MTNTQYNAFAFLEQLFSLINKWNVDIAYSEKNECAITLTFVSQIMTVTGYQYNIRTFTIFTFCSLNPSENLTSRLLYLLWGE